jgi:ABC-2 type transport system permease protein
MKIKNLFSGLNIFLVIVLAILVNLILSGLLYRIDLTAEGRYTLSETSVNMLDSLNRSLTVKVYLEGEFPAPVKRLRDAVHDMLVEMKLHSGEQLEFVFLDPADKSELIDEFLKKGIKPIPINIRNSSTQASQQYIFPVAKISYEGRTEYVDLMKGALNPDGSIDMLRAEQDLEYKLISAIRRITKDNAVIIGLLEGHKELNRSRLSDLLKDLENMYLVKEVNISTGEAISPSINVLIVAQPDSLFTERDKYEIDQYIMRGGQVFWILDQEKVDLKQGPEVLSQMRDLNLDDLFFRYGFKINYNLIQDLSCGSIEVAQPTPNGPPEIKSHKWIYYPTIVQFGDHRITRNLDMVKLRYASSIDTFEQKDIQKSVFLESSPYSRGVQGNVFISLPELILKRPPKELFNTGTRGIVGLAQQGKFTSAFRGRQVPVNANAPNLPSAVFLPANANPVRMAVISDGSILTGEEIRGREEYIPADNKTLILNCIDYLLGDDALIGIRAKELQYRALKDLREEQETLLLIRILNLAGPVILILVFGIVRNYLRKRKNTRLKLN